jgi:NitT/TauT family transport system substrate-binding protein
MIAHRATLMLAAAALVSVCGAALAQDLPKVVIGDNPSLSGAPLYLALEKGYYRDAGIDVQFEMSGTTSDMAVLLATNRLQVIGGALSAGFFNSLGKGLPISLLMSRATSPYAHYLMIRPELKGKLARPADLKGRTIAVAARGAILVYELAKILESGGLTLGDVDLKYIPFGQMATALTTGAADAALMISPLQDQVEAKGIGVKWINADWMKGNTEAAKRFVRATLRGVRDYCDAYHRGPNRDEVTRILAKYSDVKDPALIDRIEWGATDVDGRIFAASVADIQDTFVKEKLVSDQVPAEKIAPPPWVAEVAASLGPFRLRHDDGAPGCR